MFVKIKTWNVDKGEDDTNIYKDLIQETLYDAVSIDSVSVPPDPERKTTAEGSMIGKMLFTLKLNSGIEEVIYVLWKDEKKVIEIYCMNNQGKTIDRYVY